MDTAFAGQPPCRRGFERRVAMEGLPFSELGESERKLLAVFARFGRDDRAITVESLAVHTGMGISSRGNSRAPFETL